MKRKCLVLGISIFVTFCHIEAFEGIADVYFKYNSNSNIFQYVAMSSPVGGGGGGALRYRGGPHLRYVFRGRRGLFLRRPHVRDFVKEGYFFVPRYEVWESKSPYNPRNIRGSDAE